MNKSSLPVFSLAEVQRIAAEAFAHAVVDFGDSPADLLAETVDNFEALIWDAAHAAGVEGAPVCFLGAAARFRELRSQVSPS